MSGHLPGLLSQGDKKAPTMDKLFLQYLDPPCWCYWDTHFVQ